MEIESNAPELTHLTKWYYIDLQNDQLYSVHGMEEDRYNPGIRQIKWTKKLKIKLQPFIEKINREL